MVINAILREFVMSKVSSDSMMNGDDDYRSMIPCNYTPAKKQGKKIA